MLVNLMKVVVNVVRVDKALEVLLGLVFLQVDDCDLAIRDGLVLVLTRFLEWNKLSKIYIVTLRHVTHYECFRVFTSCIIFCY